MMDKTSRPTVLLLPLLTLLLGGTGAPLLAQESEAEKLRTEVRQLEKTVKELEERLAALEKEKAAAQAAPKQAAPTPTPTPTATPTSTPPAGATPTPAAPQVEGLIPDYNTVSDQQTAAPRPDNVPLDPELKGFIPIPGTQSMVKFGGYARVDSNYDFANNGNRNWWVPSSIPVPGQSGTDGGPVYTLQAKATRISLEFRRPISSSDRLRIYYENDFFGDSSSPSMTYRLRHFYGQAWNVLIGHTFTAFMNIDAWPDTIDYEGLNGIINKRQPQIRYTQPLSRGKNISQVVFLSVEQSASEINASAPGLPAGMQARNPLPDFILGYRVERKRGHLQLSALGRSLGVESDNGPSQTVFGWGFSLSGVLNLDAGDKISYQAAYGEGIARYVNDLGGLNLDAAPDSGGKLKAIPVFVPGIGYTHNWTGMFRSTAAYGYVWVEPTPSLGSLAVTRTQYATLNIVWQPTKAFRTGLEYQYGWKTTFDGASRGGSRLDFVVKYDLVK